MDKKNKSLVTHCALIVEVPPIKQIQEIRKVYDPAY